MPSDTAPMFALTEEHQAIRETVRAMADDAGQSAEGMQ